MDSIKKTTKAQLRRITKLIADLKGDLMVAELDAEVVALYDADAVEANEEYAADLKARIAAANRELCYAKDAAKLTLGDAKARALLFRASV